MINKQNIKKFQLEIIMQLATVSHMVRSIDSSTESTSNNQVQFLSKEVNSIG